MAVWRIPFFAALGLAAAALYILGSHEVDPDLFWHLKVAELLAIDGPRPIVDSFSYNSISEPWLPYSWLAELGIQRAVVGLGGVALYVVPLVCYLVTVLLVALTVADRAGATLKAATITMLVALLILPFIALRPATLAFPLCAFAAWATVSARHHYRWLAVTAVIPITVLTANIHLFFLYPPILMVAWAVGTALQARSSQDVAARETIKYLGIAAAAVGLALLANPFRLALVGVAAHYMFKDVMVSESAILEMRPFYELGPLVLGGSLILFAWPAMGLLRHLRRADRRDLALLVLASALMLSHGRYVPLAAFLLAPLAARHGAWPRLTTAVRGRFAALSWGLLLGLSVAAGQRLLREPPSSDSAWHLRAAAKYPVRAANFVRDSVPRRSGRLINPMGWGGYLIYALWPDYQVMMDGRTQVYDESLWRSTYVGATRDSRIQVFRDARADAAILPAGSPWAEILETELGWRSVYLDEVAGVWLGP